MRGPKLLVEHGTPRFGGMGRVEAKHPVGPLTASGQQVAVDPQALAQAVTSSCWGVDRRVSLDVAREAEPHDASTGTAAASRTAEGGRMDWAGHPRRAVHPTGPPAGYRKTEWGGPRRDRLLFAGVHRAGGWGLQRLPRRNRHMASAEKTASQPRTFINLPAEGTWARRGAWTNASRPNNGVHWAHVVRRAPI